MNQRLPDQVTDAVTASVTGSPVRHERDARGVITLTLDRPQAFNALSEGMLTALQTELDRAETLVGHDEVPADVVTMNSRVHCREESSGKDYHLTLVYPKDANADEGKISILAPVGSALLGLKVGQHIDWPAPGGKTLKLTLLEVESQPDNGGAFPE